MPTNHADERDKTADLCYFEIHLVDATDLQSRLINTINRFIVL